MSNLLRELPGPRWDDEIAPYPRCAMHLWTAGDWFEGVWVPGNWSRCPNAPVWVTGRSRPLCEVCVMWSGNHNYPIPGGIKTYGDRPAEYPHDIVRMWITMRRHVRDRVRSSAAQEGIATTEWLRWAIQDVLDRADPAPHRTVGEAPDGTLP